MRKGVDILVKLERELRGTATVSVVAGYVCRWSRRLTEDVPFDRQQDAPTVMAQSHVLVMPSASDGFGYVVLEAMASGCVPIVSPDAGASQIARRVDPRLVQPREGFVEATLSLLQTLPLAELSVRAREIAEEYEWSQMASAAAGSILQRLGHRLQ